MRKRGTESRPDGRAGHLFRVFRLSVPVDGQSGRGRTDVAVRPRITELLRSWTQSVTLCHEKGPKEVSVVGWFLSLTVRRRYSSGTVLPWTTIRWKFGTS